MDSWNSHLVNDQKFPENIFEPDIRETALLDDDDDVYTQEQKEHEISTLTGKDNQFCVQNEATGGTIVCNLVENELLPGVDENTDEEIEDVFKETTEDTLLKEQFDNDTFQAKFIDIDTSFSDDDDDEDGAEDTASNSLSYNTKQETDSPCTEDSERRNSSQSTNSSNLLKATISELERALSDTKRLLAARDEENAKLRISNAKLQQDLEQVIERNNELSRQLTDEGTPRSIYNDDEKEEISTKTTSGESEYALRETLKFLEESLLQKEKELTQIKGELGKPAQKKVSQENNSHPLCKRRPACRRRSSSVSSSCEIDELKTKINEQEKEIKELRERENTINNQRCVSCFPAMQSRSIKETKLCDRELNTQLRLKFLRDAFFYYMIDFHADEQIKAILAILEYEDRRQDIIFESHKMRQMGKRFTVTKVSSRCLTFVQEEIR